MILSNIIVIFKTVFELQFSVRYIEIFLPVGSNSILYYSITAGVERRRWDSNLEAVVRGLYSRSNFTNVSLWERQGADLLKLNIEYEKIKNQSLNVKK